MAELNPNIALGRPVEQLDFTRFAHLAQQRQALAQNQQLQQLAMQKAQREMFDEDELRGLVAQGGTPQELQARLMGAGRLKEAGEYAKQQTAQQTAELAQQEQIGKLVKQSAAQVIANPTEASAISVINRMEALTGQNMDRERALIYEMRGNPQQIAKWASGHALEADKLLPKIETRDLGGQVETQQIDPVTGQVVGTQSRQKTQTPDSIASNEIARGNLAVAQGNLGVNQQRLALDQEKNTRESVSQQKLDRKIAEEERKASIKEQHVMQDINNTLRKLDQIMGDDTHEGMVNRGSAGIVGKLSSFIPETPGYNLDKKIDSVKSALGFDTLQAMRDASPTGGALGQVAVRELEFLQAKVASLDIGQSPSQLKQHLTEIKNHYNNWKRIVKQSSQKEFNSMPDPALYTGKKIRSDDGTMYQSNGSQWMRVK
jgi:hypothetical protein